MEHTSFNDRSDDTPDIPFSNVTFIGGSGDLEDSPEEVPTAATRSQHHLPLAMTSVGDRVWVVEIKGGHRIQRRLTDVGIGRGSAIVVVSRTESGSIVVALQGCRIGLGAGIAHRVVVTSVQQESTQTVTHQSSTPAVNDPLTAPAPLHLGALPVGQSGRIIAYEKGMRSYREKLLSMGLTPGTEFTVTRQAPMGDPIEIKVRGFKLSLRKGEAAALQVEVISQVGGAQ